MFIEHACSVRQLRIQPNRIPKMKNVEKLIQVKTLPQMAIEVYDRSISLGHKLQATTESDLGT